MNETITVIAVYLVFFLVYLRIFGFYSLKGVAAKIKGHLSEDFFIMLSLFAICFGLSTIGFILYDFNFVNDAQLGYLGAIVGGGITLFGVYLTIEHSKTVNKKQIKLHDQERKEELALQYKPILSFEGNQNDKKLNTDGSGFFTIEITLINIGRAEAKECTVLLQDENELIHKINTYPANASTVISFSLPKSDFVINPATGTNIKIKDIRVIYYDSFHFYKYTTYANIKISFNNETYTTYCNMFDITEEKTY